jgi:predicted RNase H-like nuclease (RuvC/YqgF family)
MNYSYLYKIYINKKTIFYLLLGILIFIILSQMYYLKPTIIEGVSVNDAVRRARREAEKQKKKAEEEAEKARRKAEAEARKAEAEAKRVAAEAAAAQAAAEEAARQAAEEAARQAEEAKRLAEQLEFENAINKLLEPIKNLKNVVSNTLKSLTNF